MPATTRCPNCRMVLNLPEGAGNRRLKCPKCGTRFFSGEPGSAPPTSTPGVATAGPASSLLPTAGHGDADLPTAPGVLREMFDPSLLDDDEPKPAPKATKPRSSPPSGPIPSSGSGSVPISDVAGLFDDEPPSSRRLSAAEAKKKSRRCPGCGGVVPAGMALCTRCGMDLDTGRRPVMEELLNDTPPPPPPRHGPPFGILLFGSLALLISLILTALAFVSLEGVGRIALGLIGVFSVLASIQFLRGKSSRLLLVAMALGGVIDLVGLVIMPVVRAEQQVVARPVENGVEAPEMEDVRIPSYAERIDMRKITWGLVILAIDAAAFIYLSTSGVRRHFDRQRAGIPVPLP